MGRLKRITIQELSIRLSSQRARKTCSAATGREWTRGRSRLMYSFERVTMTLLKRSKVKKVITTM